MSKRTPDATPQAAAQTQFLDVITRDEASARFRAQLALSPLGAETVPLAAALDRVLARDIVATVDVHTTRRSCRSEPAVVTT